MLQYVHTVSDLRKSLSSVYVWEWGSAARPQLQADGLSFPGFPKSPAALHRG